MFFGALRERGAILTPSPSPLTDDTETYTCELCGATFDTPGEKGGHKRGHQVNVEREDIQEELLRLADRTDGILTVDVMKNEGAYAAGTVRSRFGSWKDALRSVGLEANEQRPVTAEDIIEDIHAVAEQLGRPPTSQEHRTHGTHTVTTAQNRFGTWKKALQAAGYQPHIEMRIPSEQLLDEIWLLVEQRGTVPTAEDMMEHGRYSHRCYFDRWGGWQAAVRAAGFEPQGHPTGPDNHRWKEHPATDWRSYGPNWETQRRRTLERDNYQCQTPGCEITSSAHQTEFGNRLHVHHVMPLSMFGDTEDDVDFNRANRLENLVTVCLRHHHLWERASPLRLDTRPLDSE